MTAETLPTTRPDAGDGSSARDRFWAGVRTVARLELRQRVRASRWVIILVVWAVLLALLTSLVHWSVRRAYGGVEPLPIEGGITASRMIFGLVTLLVLSLAALVVPALTATSINGDRAAGVLATLQTTLLTPTQIVLGKLLAAWAVALALLATAAPFLVWSFLGSRAPTGRLLVVLVVLALVLLVICSIGLGWSAVTARTSSSALLTYLTVTFLGLGLPVLFALSLPLVTQVDRVEVRSFSSTGPDFSTTQCVTEIQTSSRPHTERSWWLLAASPYAVIADAAPRPRGVEPFDEDPLTLIRTGVREARLGPRVSEDYCYDNEAESLSRDQARDAEREQLGATWPAGLAINGVLSAVFLTGAVRRLRAPVRHLPRGTRVA